MDSALIPLWLKLAYTALVLLIVAVYAKKYPPENFLWFSDIALIVTVPALWLESSLLASMMMLAVFIPECFWALSFLWQLVTGRRLSGLTDYMFEPNRPRYLRALSLFHLVLPPLLAWLVYRLGYDPVALAAMTVLGWIVLALCYCVGSSEMNVNWVFGPGGKPQRRLPPRRYLALLMLAFPLLLYVPTHWAALRWLG